MVRQALIRHLLQVVSKNDTSFNKSQVASRKSQVASRKSQVASRKSQVANMIMKFEILKSTD